MAVIGNQFLTLADWAKMLDPDGKTVAPVINMMSQTNEMLDDMIWTEGNLTDGHRTTVQTGLPTGTWRMLYQGVQPSKSTRAQIESRTGNLEGYSEVDKDLADLNGNTAQFRYIEGATFYEGMSQQMQEALLYSNSLNTPQQIMGLTPLYNSLTGAASGGNVIDAGGTGNTNTSIWIVGWGPNTAFGMFPRGKTAGFQQRDLGEVTVQKPDGSLYQAYREHFKWEAGLCVRDWRYISRIANIDVTQLAGANAANLIKLLTLAMHRFPTAPSTRAAPVTAPTNATGTMGGVTRWAIYANRTISAALDLQAQSRSNLWLKYEEWDGKPVLSFRGIPIRTVDKLLNTEARVV